MQTINSGTGTIYCLASITFTQHDVKTRYKLHSSGHIPHFIKNLLITTEVTSRMQLVAYPTTVQMTGQTMNNYNR